MITFELAEIIADRGITNQRKCAAYENDDSWLFAYIYNYESDKTIPGAALVGVDKKDGSRTEYQIHTFKKIEKKMVKQYE